MPGNAASLLLDPREYWSGLDRQSRLLFASVAVSILLHAILLTVHPLAQFVFARRVNPVRDPRFAIDAGGNYEWEPRCF